MCGASLWICVYGVTWYTLYVWYYVHVFGSEYAIKIISTILFGNGRLITHMSHILYDIDHIMNTCSITCSVIGDCFLLCLTWSLIKHATRFPKYINTSSHLNGNGLTTLWLSLHQCVVDPLCFYSTADFTWVQLEYWYVEWLILCHTWLNNCRYLCHNTTLNCYEKKDKSYSYQAVQL
jgi:hypothetical protein